MVTVSQIANILLPWTGSGLLEKLHPECVQIVKWLNSPRDTEYLSALTERITLLLFSRIRQLTNGTFIVQPDGGYPVRMQTEDFSVIADDMLLPLFMDYPADEQHLLHLKTYAMSCASLSALRALYTRFAPLQDAEELSVIAQIARGSYPPYRLFGWLN